MIDAYTHCGTSKYRPVEDVLATMRYSGIQRAVLVQHLGEFDNSYLARTVEQHPGTFTAVGLINPKDRWERALGDLIATGQFRGVRVNSQMMGDSPELCMAVLRQGLNLVVCIDEPIPALLPILHGLADLDAPGRIVLSHLGGILLDSECSSHSAVGLEFAGSQRVLVNLSGQSMFCEYPYRKLDRLIASIVEGFGASRLMWGSNFPVCGDAESYRRDLQLVRPGAWGMTDDQVQQVLYRTAEAVWFNNVA